MHFSILLLAFFTTTALSQGDAMQLGILTPSATYTGYNAFDYATPPLTIHAHPDTGCKGPYNGVLVQYAMNFSTQFNSYHLSRDLQDWERLDLLDATPGGGTMDLDFDDDLVTCSYVLESPLVEGTKKGCHTIEQPLGCLRVYEEVRPAQTATVAP